MGKAARYKTEIEGEVNSHRVLWATVRALARRASARKRGSFYFDLSTMMLSFAVVEAYANFLIHVLDPALFKVERKHFRNTGTAGKIRWIIKKSKWKTDTRRRPHTTLRILRELRNLTMHAKPDVYVKVRYHNLDLNRPMFELGTIHRKVSRDKRKRALEDVEDFCESIHKNLLLKKLSSDQLRRLEPYSLKGSTQWQTTKTNLNQAT